MTDINNDWDKAFEEARNHDESSAIEKGFWNTGLSIIEQYLQDNYLIIEKTELPIDESLISIKLSNAETVAITKYPFTADIAPSDSHYNDIQNYRREGFVAGAGWFANLRHKQKIYTKDQVEQAILMAREDVGAGDKFGWRYGIDDILNDVI
jgi:hypothetical protein